MLYWVRIMRIESSEKGAEVIWQITLFIFFFQFLLIMIYSTVNCSVSGVKFQFHTHHPSSIVLTEVACFHSSLVLPWQTQVCRCTLNICLPLTILISFPYFFIFYMGGRSVCIYLVSPTSFTQNGRYLSVLPRELRNAEFQWIFNNGVIFSCVYVLVSLSAALFMGTWFVSRCKNSI